MTKRCYAKLSIMLLFACLATAGSGQAAGLKNNEVEFSGVVQSVVVNGDGTGTLFVNVDAIELRVIVNSTTLIQNLAEELITMDELAQMSLLDEVRVNVQGKYSSSGVLANRIRVVENDDAENAFQVRGQITKIQESGAGGAISLLGIQILLDQDTVIMKDGEEVPVSDLGIGTMVSATGNIADGIWTATQINILSKGQKRGLILFEGTVDSYDDSTGEMQVAVNGPPDGNITKVLVTPDTQMQGVIEPDVYVLVIGWLNLDYSITAKEIQVLTALELIPDKRKLQVGGEATFTVKLRESSDADVTVNISVDDPSILELLDLTSGALVIPAGTQSGTFKVKALAEGMANITAGIDGTDETASASVEVKAAGSSGQTEEDIQALFSPDHIKLQPFGSREVVLHINPPQTGDVAVDFTDGDGALLVEPSRLLGNGSAKYKVMIQSLGETGNYSITATLPAELGGGTATLEVNVADSKNKP